MGKPYTLIEIKEDGTEIRQYEDGTLRNQRGQALTKIPNDGHEITHENARRYHQMRKDKILRAIEAKVMDITKTNAPAEAIGAIVGKRAEIAMKDKSRTGNDAAKIVLSAIDAYQEKAQQQSVTRNEYVMDADTIAILQQMIAIRNGDVIDAEDTENENE